MRERGLELEGEREECVREYPGVDMYYIDSCISAIVLLCPMHSVA